MRCLILGGAGFIGSHIADALSGRGHHVRVFDRPNIDLANLRKCLDSARGSVEILGGDFNNIADVADAVENMDVAIHLVCTTVPGTSNENPIYDVESNVIGTLRFLELAVEKGMKKVVFASSGGTVYGNPLTLPIPETHPTDPKCAYGITKLMIEKYLKLFHTLHGLDYVVLRSGNPYGERQRTDWVQGAVAVFLGRLLRDRRITIWGDGTVARDYFHISDLVSAFVRVIEGDTASKTYNIAGGRALSLNELLSVIRDVTGRSPRVEYSTARKLDVPENCLDIGLAARELDWSPKVDISEGVGRTWKWLTESTGFGLR